MTNKDTLCLLKECDSGTKMAVSSIDEILDKTEDSKLKQLLSETKTTMKNLVMRFTPFSSGRAAKTRNQRPWPKACPG